MTHAQAQHLFDVYAAAFSRRDVDEICAAWAQPSLISTPDRTAAFADRESFEDNTRALLSFYTQQGVRTAHKTVIQVHPINAAVSIVRTADRLCGEDGGEIVSWEHDYLLRRDAHGAWRIIAALADGEIAAWAERGTPLSVVKHEEIPA